MKKVLDFLCRLFPRTIDDQINLCVGGISRSTKKLQKLKQRADKAVVDGERQKREVQERIDTSRNAGDRATRIATKLNNLLE